MYVGMYVQVHAWVMHVVCIYVYILIECHHLQAAAHFREVKGEIISKCEEKLAQAKQESESSTVRTHSCCLRVRLCAQRSCYASGCTGTHVHILMLCVGLLKYTRTYAHMQEAGAASLGFALSLERMIPKLSTALTKFETNDSGKE